ncbi:MAG: M15 family peptidase [Verrucomicrobiaceae bacterium]|nr:MAG: M15 family peptidase [Verrucomicrobiaceae bacterium]
MATINPRNGNSFNSAFVTSQNGTRFQVDAQYQDRFQGLVNDLDARGYQFSQSGGAGGFADRTTASGGTSAHSSGLAIDINPLDNPNAGFKTNLPSDIGDIAAKNGLAWGGADKFGNPDAMHFEVPGAPGSSVKSVGQWNGPEDTAKLSAYNQKSGFSTPLDPNKPMSDGPAPTSKTANSATKGDSAAGVPPKNGQNDITGSAGEFKKQQTQTISSTMPTHEPWDGHPKSGEGPRQAVDGSSGGGSGGSSGAAGGVYNRLVDKHGFTPDQAAGIVANVTGEGLNGDWTKVTNDVGGPSSGIVQWHDKTYSSGGRYTDYVKYMNSVPGGAASLDNQTDYMANDIKKYDNGAAYKAMQGKDADGTVDAMVRKYEKPANQDAQVAKRQQLLRNFNAMKNKLPKRGDPGMAEGGSSGKPG